MAAYLVIMFDLYNTNQTIHIRITEASDSKDALKQSLLIHHKDNLEIDEIQEEYEYLLDSFEQVTEDFACVSLEETDTYVFLIYQV